MYQGLGCNADNVLNLHYYGMRVSQHAASITKFASTCNFLFLISKYMQLVEKCVFSLSLPGCTEIDTVFSLSLAGCSEMTGLQGKKGQGPQGTQKDLIKRDSLKGAIRRIHAMGRRLLLHPPHGLLPVSKNASMSNYLSKAVTHDQSHNVLRHLKNAR